MKICVVGAGAIGGWLGARLAAGNDDVCALARGATLAALTHRGWRLQTADGEVRAPARAAEGASELGEQDLVIITVKAQAMAQVAASITPLLGADTVVAPLMNGVPWWFAAVAGVPGGPLRSLDPAGAIAAAIPVARVIGGVVHASCEVPEPGVSRHVMGNQLIIGEPGGGSSSRVEGVASALSEAGFDVSVSAHVRHDIWYKLWGNMTMNPVTALTGATTDRLLADPLVRAYCSAAMAEAAAIGARLGCVIDQTPEDRHAVTARLGAFRTSMLQDADGGRSLELDAIIGAVRELGERVGERTPMIDSLCGLSRLFAESRGLR